jgi:signal peptidase II
MTSNRAPARLAAPAIIAAIVIVLDQFAKALVLRAWPVPQSGEKELLGQWLTLTYVRNDGIAFGLFQGIPQLFTITSLVIVAGAIYFYLHHLPENDRWLPIMLGLIVGGALGNVIDRLRFGYVVDFIKTLGGRFPVFNVADSAVVIGILLMALHMFFADAPRDRRLTVGTKDGS